MSTRHPHCDCRDPPVSTARQNARNSARAAANASRTRAAPSGLVRQTFASGTVRQPLRRRRGCGFRNGLHGAPVARRLRSYLISTAPKRILRWTLALPTSRVHPYGTCVVSVLAAAGWLSLLACFVHTRRTRSRKVAPLLAGTCLALAMAAMGLCAGVASLQRRAEYAADQWGASVTSPHRMAMALALLSSSSATDCGDATMPFSDHPSLAARARALGADTDSVCSEASHYSPTVLASHRPRSAPLLQSPAS